MHYCKLFKLLLKLQLPTQILRVLIIYRLTIYTNSCVLATWGAITSDYFSAVNGVKQGAVIVTIYVTFVTI